MNPKIAADLKKLFKYDPKTRHLLQIANPRSRAKEFNDMRETAHHAFSTLYRTSENPSGIVKKFMVKHDIVKIEGHFCLAAKIIATVCCNDLRDELVILSHKLPPTGTNHVSINGEKGGFLYFNLDIKDKRPTCSLQAVDILNALSQALGLKAKQKNQAEWKKAFSHATHFDKNPTPLPVTYPLPHVAPPLSTTLPLSVTTPPTNVPQRERQVTVVPPTNHPTLPPAQLSFTQSSRLQTSYASIAAETPRSLRARKRNQNRH